MGKVPGDAELKSSRFIRWQTIASKHGGLIRLAGGIRPGHLLCGRLAYRTQARPVVSLLPVSCLTEGSGEDANWREDTSVGSCSGFSQERSACVTHRHSYAIAVYFGRPSTEWGLLSAVVGIYDTSGVVYLYFFLLRMVRPFGASGAQHKYGRGEYLLLYPFRMMLLFFAN